MHRARDMMLCAWSGEIMVLVFGVILVLAGLGLAIGTWAEFWPVLRAVFTLSLLFWGAILFVVGFSERRARRQYRAATQSDPAVPDGTDNSP